MGHGTNACGGPGGGGNLSSHAKPTGSSALDEMFARSELRAASVEGARQSQVREATKALCPRGRVPGGASCIDAIPEFKNSATEQQTVEEESMLEQMAAYEGCHSRRDMVAMQRRRQKGGRSSRSSADQSKVKNHKVYSKPTVQHTFPTFQMDMIVPRCCDPMFGTKTATWTCPRCGCTEEEHKGGMCPAQALRAHRAAAAVAKSRIAAGAKINSPHKLCVQLVEWLIDTGCNQSVTRLAGLIRNRRATRIELQGISKSPESIRIVGDVVGTTRDKDGKECDVHIDEVGHLASTPLNLLAVSPLVRKGSILHLEEGNCYLLTPEKKRIPIEEKDGLYVLRLEHYVPCAQIRKACGATAAAGHVTSDSSIDHESRFCGTAANLELWHRRLGHASPKVIKVTYDRGLAEGFKLEGGKFKHGAKCNCDACRVARAHRAAQSKTRRFDVTPKAWRSVQTDLQGPVPASFNGNTYSIKFICEHSKESLVYFLKDKEPASTTAKLRELLMDLKAAGHDLPAVIKTDSGSEFYNTQANTPVGKKTPLSMFSKVCARHRIRHVVTPANNSTLNGLVERQHRSLHESANAYLYDARLGVRFWELAVEYANWVKNRIYHSALTKTPYELAHGLRPRLDRARVWGCDMYEFNAQPKIPGVPKARRLIFVGIPKNAPNGFLGFDPETRTVRLAYDVTFDEDLTRRHGNLRVFDHRRHGQDIMPDMSLPSQSDRLDSDSVRTLYSPDPYDTRLEEQGGTSPVQHASPSPTDVTATPADVTPEQESMALTLEETPSIDGEGGGAHLHSSDEGTVENFDDGSNAPAPDTSPTDMGIATDRNTAAQDEQAQSQRAEDLTTSSGADTTPRQRCRGQGLGQQQRQKELTHSVQARKGVDVQRIGLKSKPSRPKKKKVSKSHISRQTGDSLASCFHGQQVNDLSLDSMGLRERRRARGAASAVSPPSPQSSRIHKSNLNSNNTSQFVRGGEGRHLRAEAAPRASTMNKASKGRAIFPALLLAHVVAAPAFVLPRKSSDCVFLRMPHAQARPIRMQVASPTMRLAGTGARLPSHLEASVPRDKPTRSALGPRHRESGCPSNRSKPLEAPNVPPGESFRDTCDANATTSSGIDTPSPASRGQAYPAQAPKPRSATSWDSETLGQALESFMRKAAIHGPLAPKAVDEYHRQKLFESMSTIRPYRQELIGQIKKIDKSDRRFITEALERDLPIQFVMDIPKKSGSKSNERYSKYRFATTLTEMINLSVGPKVGRAARQAARSLALRDIDWDYARGYILFPEHESILPGHFIDGRALARDHRVECKAEKLGQLHGVGTATAGAAASSFQSKLESIHRMDYMDNPDQQSAFAAHHLAARQFLDPTTGTWHTEPKNEKEVNRGPDRERWKVAEKEEMDALEELGTYDLVTDCPVDRPMACKMVYKLKTDDSGVNITRWKARCVVRGFMSRPGIDHEENELYAPVLAYDSFRTLLAISAGKGWGARQIDISNAYLQGRLIDKDGRQKYIYVQDPLNRKDKKGRPYFLRLKKPLYGLKQAGRRWQEELHEHLRAHGFERLPSDKCLFKVTKKRSDLDKSYNGDEVETLIIGTYVDDILLTGSSDRIMDWFDSVLTKRFKINRSEAGQVNHMLGARIRQDLKQGTLAMDQTGAIEALAKKFKLDGTNANARTSTPMTQERLPKQERITDESGFPYLSAVGSLLHIAGLTRPDISYAVGVVARYSNAYGERHIKAVKKIIAYLYHTRFHGIMYYHESIKPPGVKMFESGRPPITDEAFQASVMDPLRLFADADFAGDDTKRSTSGNIVYLFGGPIMWSSRLQKLYALSTAESEIYSATEALKDAAFLQVHLSSLGIRDGLKPIPVHEDNAACRMMAENDLKVFNKARHYLVRLGFLQDKVTDGTAKFVQTDTSDMIADALTKPLVYDIFAKFRDVMVKDVRKGAS